MNIADQALVYLLSAAMSGEQIEKNKIQNLNWKIVFEEVKKQDLCSFLYPVIKNLDLNDRPEGDTIEEWKKNTVLTGIIQNQNINKMELVFEAFNKAHIPVIALKGLVLREFYPQKDLRNMSDSDILIHEEDLEKAEKILLGMGYFEDHRDSKHVLFLHKNTLPIELHWALIDTAYFKHAQYLEMDVWENTDTISIGKEKVIIPSLENQILHLCIHMATHFVYSGFGLRQLCDLVLLVKAKRSEVDWDSFYEKTKKCKIESFVLAIFEVCRRLFYMVIPDKLYNNEVRNSPYIDLVIHSILSGGVFDGVFGKQSLGPINDNILSYYDRNLSNNSILKKLKYLMWFFFPLPKSLSERYKYARKCPLLLPVAWIHRMIYSVIRKDFNISEKSVLLLSNSDTLEKRVKLFKWLDLQ